MVASAVVTTAQSALAERRAARKAALLAKYDLNGDGQVSRDERRQVKAADRAARAAAKAERKKKKVEPAPTSPSGLVV